MTVSLYKYIAILSYVFICISTLNAQNFTGGFNFYLPPDDTTSQRFLPCFPIQRIGDTDFVFVDSQGHFAVRGKPIRFWGTNAVADGAFPTKSKAWFIAGRLRKMGFNLVRFHHMDNSWTRGSLFEWGQDTRHLNPVTLDRFERFIAELKNNGIYANINLHVSRTFNQKDGVPDADSIKDFGKGVTYFNQQLIDLQKEYARQLLTHVNPYTRLLLVNDPVMAMVEITNENSLYRMWRDGKLKPLTSGGNLIVRHNYLLDSLWQEYLIEKYGDTDNLGQVWNQGIREAGMDDQVHDGSFEHVPITRYWVLELHSPANGAMGAEIANPFSGNICARVIVSQADGVNWHVQWKQTNLTIYNDSLYTVSFAGRADANRSITVSVMREAAPWTVFYSQTFVLSQEWQTYRFSFRASETCINNTRLSFLLGGVTGIFWFDEIHFSSSEIKGLAEDESLELRTVRRIDFSECVSYSDVRVMDMTAFYIELQNDFFAEMVDYLKNELGVKVPIVGTNWNVGPPDLSVQSQLDYIDNHSYWDHPHFPNIPWSSTDWLISNTPMVLSESGGTIPVLLGGVGFQGKSFTVSEYNHAFPNRYQTEGVLFLSSYSAFHDLDGIMFFDYSSISDDWESDKVNGFFSIHRNTAMMALMPSCARAYRDYLVASAQQTILLNYSRDDVLCMPKYDNRDWQGPETFPRKLALQHAVRVKTFQSDESIRNANFPLEPSNPYQTDTGEITWDTDGLFKVDSPRFVATTGFLDQYPDHHIGPMTLISANGFATLSWISLTTESLTQTQNSLITLSSKLQNSRMIWDGIHTVHNNWGEPPTRINPIIITLRLNINADSIRVFPLDIVGAEQITFITYLPTDQHEFEITLDQHHDKTVWYGMEQFSDNFNHYVDENGTVPEHFEIHQNYPNPFYVSGLNLNSNAGTSIRYVLPCKSNVQLIIYDLLGRQIHTLVDQEQPSGKYRAIWDGRDNDGRMAGSGVYFYKFWANSPGQEFHRVLKLLVFK